MRTMDFECPVHGQLEITLLERGQDIPIWCPIYKDGTREPCGKRLKRIYSVPAVHYRGNGFYKTDHK